MRQLKLEKRLREENRLESDQLVWCKWQSLREEGCLVAAGKGILRWGYLLIDWLLNGYSPGLDSNLSTNWAWGTVGEKERYTLLVQLVEHVIFFVQTKILWQGRGNIIKVPPRIGFNLKLLTVWAKWVQQVSERQTVLHVVPLVLRLRSWGSSQLVRGNCGKGLLWLTVTYCDIQFVIQGSHGQPHGLGLLLLM